MEALFQKLQILKKTPNLPESDDEVTNAVFKASKPSPLAPLTPLSELQGKRKRLKSAGFGFSSINKSSPLSGQVEAISGFLNCDFPTPQDNPKLPLIDSRFVSMAILIFFRFDGFQVGIHGHRSIILLYRNFVLLILPESGNRQL